MRNKETPGPGSDRSILPSGSFPTGKVTREMELSVLKDELNARAESEDRRIPVAISSENPYQRYDWWEGQTYLEVLDHSPESVDLSRAEDGLPFLLDHNRTIQVGLLEEVRLEDKKIRAEIRMGNHPDADWLERDIRAGIRTKISVGYTRDPNNIEKTQGEDDKLPTVRIKRWTPLEGSSVAIPADPTVGIGRSEEELVLPPAGTATPTAQEAKEESMDEASKLAQQRAAEEAAGKAATGEERARVQAIRSMVLEHKSLDLQDRVEEWISSGRSEEEVGTEILEAYQKAAKPVAVAEPTRAPTVITGNRKDEDAGLVLGAMVRALAFAKGDVDKAVRFARENIHEEAARALMAGDEVAGGFLVAPDTSEDIIELLRPMSVFRKLNPRIYPMDGGQLRIRKITGGATGYYTEESSNITKSEQTTGTLELNAKKLAALVPISNDLLRRTRGAADAIVRDDIVLAIDQRGDLAFIRGDGAQNTPMGLRYLAPSANVIAANGTVSLANVTIDLGKLILALEEADVKMVRPGWLMAPRTKHYLMTVRDGNGNFAYRQEMLGGTLDGYPFGVTSQIPKNLGSGSNESELYFADFFDVALGETTNLILDASGDAAYHDGSGVVAAFSKDETVVRAIIEHDLGMRHDEAVALLTGVKWGV
jgi:HK97 family phage major capsid protein